MGQRGYTLLEVMIFLAISTFLFVAAMAAIGGQQKRVRFSQGMRDINSKIEDILNDVTTGYYPTSKTIRCQANAALTGLDITAAAGSNANTAQNKDCVLLGKAIQIGLGSDKQQYNVYTVAGLRTRRDTTSYAGESYRIETQTLTEAAPTVVNSVAVPTQNGADLTERLTLPGGIKLKSVTQGTNMVGFYSSLAGGQLASIETRDTATTSYALKNATLVAQGISFGNVNNEQEAAQAITNGTTYGITTPYAYCFASTEGDQTALLSIGQSGGSLNTKLEFISC